MALVGSISLVFGNVQHFIIFMIENFIVHRNISDTSAVQYMLKILSCLGSVLSALGIAVAILLPKPDKIEKYFNILVRRQLFGESIKNIIVAQPFLLISFIFILYILKNIFLVLVTSQFDVVIIAVAMPLHIFLAFMLYRGKNKNMVVYLASCYGILIVSCIVNAFIYDYSWDGQAYHQVAAIRLSNGWNPFYASLPEESVFIWNNHYPKFTEMYASILLSIFKNIEVGKSYNMIFFVITLCYALTYTSRYQKNKCAIMAISLLFTANPVVMAQFFTFYVDGFLGMLIMTLFFACMDYERQRDRKDLIIIIAVSVFAINTKFTGFICGVVLIGYVVKQLVAKKYKQMFIFILSGILILLIGLIFTGYNPYITNLLDFGHPFYPLYGENSVDIISPQITEKVTIKNFYEMYPIQRFFSLFILNYNLKTLPFNPMKLLYLASHQGYDFPIGGFGLLFVEICIFIGLIVLFTIRNKKLVVYKELLFPVCLLLVITIIIPDNWMARYIPFFWYIFAFLIMASNYTTARNKKLFYLLLILISINSGSFFIGNTMNGAIYTMGLKRFMAEIKQYDNDTIHIVLGREYFKHSIIEKMKYHNIGNHFIFIEDDTILYTNGVSRSYIRGWY